MQLPAMPAGAKGAKGRNRSAGCFGAVEEAAVARDIAVVWRRLALNESVHGATERFNVPLDRCAAERGRLRTSHANHALRMPFTLHLASAIAVPARCHLLAPRPPLRAAA